jgi:hypothetical protein
LAHGEAILPTPSIDPNELVGCTFLMPQQEDGQWFWACIIKVIEDHETELRKEEEHIQFLCLVNDGQYEEIVSYYDLLNSLELEEAGKGSVWKFQWITGHQGPLKQNDKDYNVLFEKET